MIWLDNIFGAGDRDVAGTR